MASARKPGPLCYHNDSPVILDGTACLSESPKPGTIGVQPIKTGSLVDLITETLLTAVMPRLSLECARTFIIPLHRYLEQYNINTLRRISAFLGQIAVESAEFSRLEENLRYTRPERLRSVFPNYFKEKHPAEEYVKNPEKLANLIYANKIGNNDETSGDGWRYRGRGLIQLTGRYNYSKFTESTGIDILNNPDLLTTPEYAVYSSAWFWDMKNLNDYADVKNYKKLTALINAACLHFAEREIYRKRTSQILLRSIGK